MNNKTADYMDLWLRRCICFLLVIQPLILDTVRLNTYDIFS